LTSGERWESDGDGSHDDKNARSKHETSRDDPQTVAVSKVIPLHPGAIRYYRERGDIK
jgi:TRAP-type uncharacterized transport system substrate-binding protein